MFSTKVWQSVKRYQAHKKMGQKEKHRKPKQTHREHRYWTYSVEVLKIMINTFKKLKNKTENFGREQEMKI